MMNESTAIDILRRAVRDHHSTDPQGGWLLDAERLLDDIDGDQHEQDMLDDVERHERAMFYAVPA